MVFYCCPFDGCLYLVPRCLDEKCVLYDHTLNQKRMSDFVTENTHEKK